MATILNPSFEDWNFGTLISDPTDGQQLADNWYWNKGFVVPSVIIQKVTAPPPFPYEGSFSMRVFAGSGGGGGNTTTYVYQDISSIGDMLGKICVFSAAIYTPSVTGVPGHFFVSDGLNIFYSASSPADDTWHVMTVTMPISPSASQVRIGLVPDNYGFTNVFFDAVTLNIVQELNLVETSFLNDSMQTSPIIHLANETIRTNDWLTIKSIPPKQWTNSDNNNQYPV